MINFLRRFFSYTIRNIRLVIKILKRKGSDEFQWTEKQQVTFQDIKVCLTKSLVLTHQGLESHLMIN
jgi:hypothetical protein